MLINKMKNESSSQMNELNEDLNYNPLNTKIGEFNNNNKEEENNNYQNVNFDQFISGYEYKNVIVVDPLGEYNTIQKAIDDAKPFTTIKIKPGVYRESLVVTKPFLDIDSENHSEPAIIISSNKPCLLVDKLKKNESIRISNIKLTNKGIVQIDNEKFDYTKL